MRHACWHNDITATQLGYLNVTAGTTAASKAVVQDASSKVSALDITALKIGGTSVTATAAEVNAVADGYVGPGVDGIGYMQVARFTFDPSGVAAHRTVAAHGLGVTIPDNALILGGGIEILTGFADGASDAATIALSIASANDLITATAISSGTFWDAVKYKVIVPDAMVAAGVATPIKLAAAKEVTVTVAEHALTAGKFVGWLFYVQGA
jgi:hypothetical protein